MDAHEHRPAQRCGALGESSHAARLAILVVAVANVVILAAGVAARASDRVVPAVGARNIGYRALVNTLGLRSVFQSQTLDLAGRYVTIAEGRRRVEAREANQLFAEFGVFRAGRKRFKLLGVDGAWVKIRRNLQSGQYQAGTWGGKWSAAWSFKLLRPKEVDPDVNSALMKVGTDAGQVVCVQAYSPRGKAQGLLVVSEPGGLLLLDRKAGPPSCGGSLPALFITDSLPRGMAPGGLLKGVKIDPMTYVRFVAPDVPARTLSVARRRQVRTEVETFFNALRDDNRYKQGWVEDTATDITLQLLTDSYVIPEEEAKDVNLAKFFEMQASYVLTYAGLSKTSSALKQVYDIIELGVALAHNANLSGPRVVEGISNEVLTTAAEVKERYRAAFEHTEGNIVDLEDMILEGCRDPRKCASDRRLAAWWRADPAGDIDDSLRSRALQEEVALHELAIWRILLPIRGRLYARETEMPGGGWDCADMDGPFSCDMPYPYDSPYKNDDILGLYARLIGDLPSTWDLPVVTTGLYRPYHNWFNCGVLYSPYLTCAAHDVFRPIRQGWVLALANDDSSAMTPVGEAALQRLFDLWDPDEPVTSGFGLSRSEVACEWLYHDSSGYTGRHGYYWNPCHSAFFDDEGGTVSPYEDEDGHYDEGVENSVTFWTPDTAEVLAGRSLLDPDVVSPQVPRLAFGSCAAFEAGTVRSVSGGDEVHVVFTNLYDGPVDVHWILADGSTTLAFGLPRQDQLARPLAGDSLEGQFDLVYSDRVPTTAGVSFLVTNSVGECIGTWTAEELPANAPVDYAVAEVHGAAGILLPGD